jgi:ATP-dependent DNA ligase
MGCKKVKDEVEFNRLINSHLFYGQKKLDGVRCILQFDEEGFSRYTTRGASVDDSSVPIEITHRLRHMAIKVPVERPLFQNLILDGELYSPKYTAAKVAGMVSHKSTVPVDPDIKLYIFDILGFRNQDITDWSWIDRMSALEIVKQVFEKKPEKFQFVPWVKLPQEKLDLFHKEIEEGREGIVLKAITAKYYVGKDHEMKPTGIWYKMKCEDTIDGELFGAEPPEEFYTDPDTNKKDYNRHTKFWDAGLIGALLFRFTDQEGKVHVGKCSGMTDDVRAMFSHDNHTLKPEYVGRTIEVKYMQKTEDGNLRSPRFIRLREEIEK